MLQDSSACPSLVRFNQAASEASRGENDLVLALVDLGEDALVAVVIDVYVATQAIPHRARRLVSLRIDTANPSCMLRRPGHIYAVNCTLGFASIPCMPPPLVLTCSFLDTQ